MLLLRYICMLAKFQSCTTLCEPMGCSPSGSSVHGILQARILEWVIMMSSREFSQPRGSTLYLLQFLEERKNKVSGPGFLRKWSTKAFLGGTTLELQGGGGKGRIEAGKITGNDVLPS